MTFETSPPRRFDIVVGADGLHSVVRHLTFGAESGIIRHPKARRRWPMPMATTTPSEVIV